MNRPLAARRPGTAFVILPALVAATLALWPQATATAAEPFEATHCFAGVFAMVHGGQGQDGTPLSEFKQHGIFRSKIKAFDQMATYCAGHQRGGGDARQGSVVCRLVDADGDAILLMDQYTGLKNQYRFQEGTGKWKGITGTYESIQVARSPKAAAPNSYHVWTELKGSYEVRK